MKMKEGIIGVDIGGTNFRIGLVTEQGEAVCFRKVPVKSVFVSGDSLRDFERYLKEDYFKELESAGYYPQAISIGFPATVDKRRKKVLQAPNIPFSDIEVVDPLSKALGIPVVIEKDTCMALCFDKRKYHIPDCDVLLAIYFGTGIGNAIQIFGKPLVGKNGTAGELSHIPVDGSDKACGCGNKGCMEPLGGGRYLAELCETIYQDTNISDLFTEHGSDPLLLQFVDRLAITVATEINIFDPDYMLIGGGVVNMKDFPREYLIEKIHEHARKPYPEQRLDEVLIFTEDEKDKCVIGAALFGQQMLSVV